MHYKIKYDFLYVLFSRRKIEKEILCCKFKFLYLYSFSYKYKHFLMAYHGNAYGSSDLFCKIYTKYFHALR